MKREMHGLLQTETGKTETRTGVTAAGNAEVRSPSGEITYKK